MVVPACPSSLEAAVLSASPSQTELPNRIQFKGKHFKFTLRGAWVASALMHAGLVGLLAAFMPVVTPQGFFQPDQPVSVALLLEETEVLPSVTVLPPELQPSPEPVVKMPEPEPEAASPETQALEEIETVVAIEPATMPLDSTNGAVTAVWEQVPVRKQPTPAPAQPAPKSLAATPAPATMTTASGGGGGGGSGTGVIGVGGGAGSGSGKGTGNGSGFGSGNGSGYGSGNGSGYGSGTGSGYGPGVGTAPAKPEAPKGKTCSARPKAQIAPRYPEGERKAGRTASVLLEVLIDEKGKLKDVRVLSEDVAAAFAESAIAAAKSARFEPALEDGVPVASYVKLRIDYRLR